MAERKTGGAEYNVTALRKSVAVMEVLAGSEVPLGVSELARRSDVSKNMVFRILETLTDMGWVQQIEPGPVYSLTLVPFHLFAGTQARANLLELAMPVLRDLHRDLEETVYISVLHERQAMHIQVLRGTNPISVSGKIGGTYALHCTAPGKVLLAGMTDTERAKVLSGRLKKYTSATITAADRLEKQLQQVVRQGYAVNMEEHGPGMLGLAAPLKDADGNVLAAMGTFVPATNIAPENLEKHCAGRVRTAAQKVSALFGYTG